KVSSSERLRALSKLPLEDPSKWRIVNPQSELDDSAATGADDSGPFTKSTTAGPSGQVTSKPSSRPKEEKAAPPRLTVPGSPLQDLEQHDNDDSSEEDYI